MLKKLGLMLGLAALLAAPAISSAQVVTKGMVQRLNLDQLTLNGHTITAAEFNVLDGVTPGTVLASGAVIVDASKNISNFNNVGITGTLTNTRTPTADSAATDNASKILLTAPVDTTGTNTHQGWDLALTVGNATGGTNTVNGWNFENYTGDAQVNVNAIKIGTSDGLGTAIGVNIGTGWTAGIQSSSPINAGLSGAAGTINIFPATAANGKFIVSAINNTGNFSTTLTNKNIGQSTVYSLPECSAATCDVLTTTAAQTITGVNTFGAASGIVSKTSTSLTDINPPFDNRILGNPVVKYVYGSCTVAAVNAGTCIPLALASSRTISVITYDIVAAGSAATCTGILLEDTNGTPVVASTIAAAALTSGTHNFPGLANNVLGVGFGAGTGLTASQGLQIKVNGSGCTTTTAFQYAITYSVQ